MNLNIDISQDFLREAQRLRIKPEILARWLCDQFADHPPLTIALPAAEQASQPKALAVV